MYITGLKMPLDLLAPLLLYAYSGFVKILGPLVIDDMSWNHRESLFLRCCCCYKAASKR